MAQFEVVAREGLKMVRCVVSNEMVRAESGALHYMRGQIEIASSAPSVGGFLKSVVTRENIFRPTYQGTGEIFFGPPIFGEYEVLELSGDEWILAAKGHGGGAGRLDGVCCCHKFVEGHRFANFHAGRRQNFLVVPVAVATVNADRDGIDFTVLRHLLDQSGREDIVPAFIGIHGCDRLAEAGVYIAIEELTAATSSDTDAMAASR